MLKAWLDKNWHTLVFNICETIGIFIIGLVVRLPITNIICFMLIFMISRGIFGKALHFKTWYRCLLWSSLIMLSLFLVTKVNLLIAFLIAIFSAFLMTGRANVKDMYLWNNEMGSKSKYQDVIDFIKCNELNSNLVNFENKLKELSDTEYLIYKYKFKECKTFKEMNDLLNLENPRIVENLDKIAFAIRLYCSI